MPHVRQATKHDVLYFHQHGALKVSLPRALQLVQVGSLTFAISLFSDVPDRHRARDYVSLNHGEKLIGYKLG